MKHTVELYIMKREIEQVGKDRAFDRIMFEAWYRVLQDAKPKQSLILVSVETDEFDGRGPHAYQVRCIFSVDPEPRASVQWPVG